LELVARHPVLADYLGTRKRVPLPGEPPNAALFDLTVETLPSFK